MPVRHFIWAVSLLLAVALTAVEPEAQTTPQPVSRTSRGYTVFVAGAVVGREDVTVEFTADGILISGQGRLSGSQDVIIRRVEVRYGRDWTPTSVRARSHGQRRGDRTVHVVLKWRRGYERDRVGARKEAITRDLFAYVDRVEELPDGFGFRFPAADPWAAKALEFIEVEKECCPFFTFELAFEPDDGPLWLRLRGSATIKEFVRADLGEIVTVPISGIDQRSTRRRTGWNERNKAVVRRLVAEVLNGGRLEVIPELYAPGIAAAAREWIAPFRASFPDVRMEVIDLIAERRDGRGHGSPARPRTRASGWGTCRPIGASRRSTRCRSFDSATAKSSRPGESRTTWRALPSLGWPDFSHGWRTDRFGSAVRTFSLTCEAEPSMLFPLIFLVGLIFGLKRWPAVLAVVVT